MWDEAVSKSIYQEILELDQNECRNHHERGYFYYSDKKIQIDKNNNKNFTQAITHGSFESQSDCKNAGEIMIMGEKFTSVVRQTSFSILIKKGLGKIDLESKNFIL